MSNKVEYVKDFETYEAMKFMVDDGLFLWLKWWWDNPLMAKNIIMKIIFLPVSIFFMTILYMNIKRSLKKFKHNNPEHFL